MTSNACLNARFLIRADDIVPVAQRFALSGSSVQVQNTFCLFGELRVTWKDPVLIPPGFDRVRVEDAPDGAGTNRSPQGHRRLVSQVRSRQPTQRQFGLTDSLTGDCLDDGPVSGGKRRACVRGPLDPLRKSLRLPNGGASDGRNWRAGPPVLRQRRSINQEIHAAREPSELFGADCAEPFVYESGFDIAQETHKETWAGREERGRTWRDSIDKERSILQPGAPRIDQLTHCRNLTVNCE